MKTVKVPKMLGMVALALAGGAFAAAQDSGWYVGANIGQSRSRIAADQITGNLMGAGFTVNNPNAVSGCGCGSSFRTAESSGAPGACHH